jgi:hypothetical protein
MTGCSGLASDSSIISAKQVIDKTVSAMNLVKSFTLNTYLTRNYTVLQKAGSPAVDSWEWQSRRLVDVSNQELDYSMDYHAVPDDLNSSILNRYLVGGWEYFNSLPLAGGNNVNPWTKHKLDEEDNITWTEWSQLPPQIELLQSAGNIKSIGTDTLNGINCEIIQFNPSAKAAADWVLSQEQGDGPQMWWWGTGLEKSREIYIKAYKNSLVKIWINKDDNLILKENISLNFDLVQGNVTRDDIGLDDNAQHNPDDAGFKDILVECNGQWEFSNYDQPVQIQLPQEALIAK